MSTKRIRTPRIYPVAEIIDVHDGDTVRVRADVGFDFIARKWIRFKDVDAPELDEDGGPEAKEFLIKTLNERAPDGMVTVTTFWTPGTHKEINEDVTFIRYVGLITLLSGIDLNAYMNGYLRMQP